MSLSNLSSHWFGWPLLGLCIFLVVFTGAFLFAFKYLDLDTGDANRIALAVAGVAAVFAFSFTALLWALT